MSGYLHKFYHIVVKYLENFILNLNAQRGKTTVDNSQIVFFLYKDNLFLKS